MTSLEMKQGDSWAVQVGWFNPVLGTLDTPDLDNPIDITGYSARLQIRRSIKDTTTSLLELTSPSGGLAVDGPNGTVTARATPAQTAAVAFGACYWELEIFNGTDNYTLDEGLITVERQLT